MVKDILQSGILNMVNSLFPPGNKEFETSAIYLLFILHPVLKELSDNLNIFFASRLSLNMSFTFKTLFIPQSI